MNRSRIFSTNNLIVIFFTLFYGINMLLGFRMNAFLALDPQLVLSKFQFWRLFTFPLCTTETESILLFIFMYGIVAVRVENFFKIINFKIVLPILFLLEGILFTFAYQNIPAVLTGADAGSFAIMTILVMVYRKKTIFPELIRLKKTITFSLLFLVLWVAAFAFKTEVLAVPGITESVTCGLLCGIFAAIVCMIKINSEIKYRMLFFIRLKEKEAEEKVAAEERRLQETLQQRREAPIIETDEEDKDSMLSKMPAPEDKEEKLNRLLDKISASGTDALTDEEKNFLTEYSKYIK